MDIDRQIRRDIFWERFRRLGRRGLFLVAVGMILFKCCGLAIGQDIVFWSSPNLDKICKDVRVSKDGKLYCAKAVEPYNDIEWDKSMRRFAELANRRKFIESNRDDYRFRHLWAFPIW